MDVAFLEQKETKTTRQKSTGRLLELLGFTKKRLLVYYYIFCGSYFILFLSFIEEFASKCNRKVKVGELMPAVRSGVVKTPKNHKKTRHTLATASVALSFTAPFLSGIALGIARVSLART